MSSISLDFKIMKDDEFAVLCAMCGINKFFGSLNVGVADLDKQQVYNILYKLINKQIVVYEDDGIALAKDIRPIIAELKQVKKIISFVNTTTNINQSFYYSIASEYCINIEKRWEDSSSIWIRKVKKTDILDICYDIQLLPSTINEEDFNKETHKIFKEMIELTDLSISLYDILTEIKYREIIFEKQGLETSLILKDANTEIYRDIYSQEIVGQLVTRIIGECYDNG